MKGLSILFWVFIFCALTASGASVNLGYSDEKALLGLEDAVSETREGGSPYAVEEYENAGPDLGLSRDGLIEEVEMEPAMGKTAHDSGQHESEHEEHQMSEIKMSEHEWVTTSQKGYSVAVGITLLAGAVFGVMNFKRSP